MKLLLSRSALSILVLLALLLSVVALPAAAEPDAPLANPLRISQVYGGGGNTGATYRNDFIELFNAGTTTINLNRWCLPVCFVGWYLVGE